MKRVVVLSVSLLVVAVVAVPVQASPGAPDGAKRGCGTINLGGVRIFFKENMRCETAKHYARRLYKTNGQDEPRKFSCESGSNFNDGGSCEHDFKNKRFGWHPADKRNASNS